MFQPWKILDSQPINENRITLGETVSDPAIYSSVQNASSEKVSLESSQKRGAERIHMKMPPKALYLSTSSFIKDQAQEELCMHEYKGTCDGTSWVPSSEAWQWSARAARATPTYKTADIYTVISWQAQLHFTDHKNTQSMRKGRSTVPKCVHSGSPCFIYSVL